MVRGIFAANTDLIGYGTVSIPLNSADTVTATGGTLNSRLLLILVWRHLSISIVQSIPPSSSTAQWNQSINPNIIFIGSDDGVGVLDLRSISLSDFHGVIANFDEGKSIDVAGATQASLEANGTSLDVYNQSTLIGTLALSTTYAGDTFNVSNGVITVHDLAATLDSSTAAQGVTIHVVAVTDDHADVAASASYAWQVFNGTDWVAANGATTNVANYTPVEADEGQALRLVVSLANDPSGTESSTYNLGTVQESAANDLVATLDSGTATQGAAIHVTAVTDGGLDASDNASYAWQVFNGTDWVAANGATTNVANYTPVEAAKVRHCGWW